MSSFVTPLICTRCGGNGSDPVCSGAAEKFHVFADVLPDSTGSTTMPTTDVTTHVINLDAPPEDRWGHIIPLYAEALRALVPVIKREVI